MSAHPKTGLRYIISFSGGPAFSDVQAMYERYAEGVDWMDIIVHTQLTDKMIQDERAIIVMWGVLPPLPPTRRKAKFVHVYSEALDEDPKNMLDNHQRWLKGSRDRFELADAAFGHTPWMAGRISSAPGFVLPVGWGPQTMGEPNWSCSKTRRFAYVGAMAGKRRWALPAMSMLLGDALGDVSGSWGVFLHRALNQSWANLYLSHSDIQSFSTFRIWQTLASSAALIAESGRDCWPMTEEMYVCIPTLTPENASNVARDLLEIHESEFAMTSRRLHEGLSHFTIDYVIENYLIPASIQIKEQQK